VAEDLSGARVKSAGRTRIGAATAPVAARKSHSIGLNGNPAVKHESKLMIIIRAGLAILISILKSGFQEVSERSSSLVEIRILLHHLSTRTRSIGDGA
jgi:hypothetical protein